MAEGSDPVIAARPAEAARSKAVRRRAVAAAVALFAAAGAGPAVAGQPDGSTLAGYSARTSYVLRCSGCHGLTGAGSDRGGIPQLADFVGAFAADEDGRTYVVTVPGVRNARLTPRQTADVLNYVMEKFAGASLPPGAPPFTEAEVAARQALPVTDVVALRRAVAARLQAAGIEAARYPWP